MNKINNKVIRLFQKYPIVPQGRNFINRRCSEAQSTDKTPSEHRIPSGMQPDSQFTNKQ